jgi:hypothetical protein
LLLTQNQKTCFYLITIMVLGASSCGSASNA